MSTTISLASIARSRKAMPPINTGSFTFKTIAIYPNAADADRALALLKNNSFTNVESKVEEAIGLVQWVVVIPSHDEGEALHAQALLPHSRIVRETESSAKPN